MDRNGRKIVIIGGGIGGLCAAVYALKCGYHVEVLDMHDVAGGLAMSWRRGDYIFETCLHWLVGSNPSGDFHDLWREIFDIDKLHFIDPEVLARIESETGAHLSIYTDIDRLEDEFLRQAPQDSEAILDLVHSVRALTRFRMIDPSASLADHWRSILHDLPAFPLLGKLSRISGEEYGRRFSDPLLRSFFSSGDIGKMSAVAMILSLAWMTQRNAGYCIGGSQAIIRLIEDHIRRLGGIIRFDSRVERILVDRDTAIGVQLTNGEAIPSDWVISAADGHTTIFDLLNGRYADADTRRLYEERPTFASYLQVSLGVALDLAAQPPSLTRLLATPLRIDPETALDAVSFRFFHFDPTFAPPGKTAVTCLLPTRNFEWWNDLRCTDPVAYHTEKHRVADAVMTLLDERIQGLRAAVEVVDVSTPATVLRYTGNWKGTMEGWLLEPGAGFHTLPNTLLGLDRFFMVGQWVSPGGGLPAGPITARPAIKAICHRDRVPFTPRLEPILEPAAV